jgi:hypothetical protein
MKNRHIIIEKILSYNNIIILTKKLSIYSTFFFKKMVTEMLLNNYIQFTFYSNDFKLSKGNKCNYVHC